ncbi:MAG TPA: P-loop NTPase fold protein, partial [Phycisphaerae bacterium]|nr:P-loop NTPase fold protein [Phycisphaerae bacterium]
MKARPLCVASHILDSLLVVAIAAPLAAGATAVIVPTVTDMMGRVFGKSDLVNLSVLVLATLLFSALVAGLSPRLFPSLIGGVRHFPAHWGLAIRCLFGGYLCIALIITFSGQKPFGVVGTVLAMMVYTGILSLALLAAWAIAKGLDTQRQRHQSHSSNDDLPPDVAQADYASNGTDFHAWLTEDQPIEFAGLSRMASHNDTAKRMLKRLISQIEHSERGSANLAIIGPYGSGKTSICNLVRFEYEQNARQERDKPRLVFCRFEAWQYQSPEAALRGLMDVAAETVLGEADEASLWRLGENYVQAVSHIGSGWMRCVATLLGGTRQSDLILAKLSGLLRRLNVHLVVFVDDLDRIESTAPEQTQAIVQALNRFQNAPHIHYVVAVGPTRSFRAEHTGLSPMSDLLKLTRFQELVPTIDPEVTLGLVRQLRDQAMADSSLLMPWTIRSNSEPDPLPTGFIVDIVRHTEIGLPSYHQILVELLGTVREIKAVLRETHAAWEHGLKGEINWYDLLLANALKMAERSVFEWILRDPDFFTIEKHDLGMGHRDPEEKQKKEEEVTEHLRSLIGIQDASQWRYKVVESALAKLFPVFARKIGHGTLSEGKANNAAQRLASTPPNGQSYLYRFTAGCVPRGDIHDRPTLEYFKKVRDHGFDPEEFRNTYLDSFEHLTGHVNRVVQFSALLGEENAMRMCEVVLDWAAMPESITIWPQPEAFFEAMCSNVHSILEGSHAENLDPWHVENLVPWLERRVPELAAKSPTLAALLIRSYSPTSIHFDDPTVLPEPKAKWAKTVSETFIYGKKPLEPVVAQYPFQLSLLVFWLDCHLRDYDQTKKVLTSKLITEVENGKSAALLREILLSLTSRWSRAVMDGPVPANAYQFEYDKELNEKRFNMAKLIPFLR